MLSIGIVIPLVGMGIEIFEYNGKVIDTRVIPLVGMGIEMAIGYYCMQDITVIPLVGMGIEISNDIDTWKQGETSFLS